MFTALPSTVIAGCGYVGRALSVALRERLSKEQGAAQSEMLVAWSRRGVWAPSPEEELPDQPPCPLRALDLCSVTQPELAAQLSQTRRVVLSYAAGRKPSPGSSIYLQAPQKILPLLAKGTRVVALSSTSALPELDLELDESCTLAPRSPRGQLQRQAEDQLWELVAKHGLELVILRLAGIYGPGRPLTRLYGRPKDEVRPGDGHVATNLIHRDDIVATIQRALTLRGPIHRLYHLCGQDHPSRRSMIDWAHQELGHPLPAWSAPPGKGPVRGKRVCATRVFADPEFGGLGGRLLHPHHDPAQLRVRRGDG